MLSQRLRHWSNISPAWEQLHQFLPGHQELLHRLLLEDEHLGFGGVPLDQSKRLELQIPAVHCADRTTHTVVTAQRGRLVHLLVTNSLKIKRFNEI